MIEIKYAEGCIEINLGEFFETGGIGAFRKLIKMSMKSDKIYGTRTVSEWQRAIDEQLIRLEKGLVADKSQQRKKIKLEKFKGIARNAC